VSNPKYERLTAADQAFLELERADAPMHIGAVCIYDLGSLENEAGGLDFQRLYRHTAAALPLVPRFRQRLAAIPLFGRPVWVDDEHFNLHYHLRHAAVPRPGDTRHLKRLAGRILSQPLDRRRPLWEMWFIEGLAGGRFAVINKAHHCMFDGVAGAGLLAAIMAVDPERATVDDWTPRPHPAGVELVVDEVLRRATLVPTALRAVGGALVQPRHAVRALGDAAHGLAELLWSGSVSPSPLNVAIGPHRRFDWTRCDLAAMREIGHRLGGTVNDVALAVVTGALRSAWRRRRLAVDAMDCRALVSVSVRGPAESGALGNRVATLLATLPIDEADPGRRVQRIAETLRAAKASHQVLGAEIIEELSDWTSAGLLVALARFALRGHAYTIDVTNIPGPPMPLSLLGAPLREIYALTPLVHHQALAIALFSYNGGMHWGFNADWEALPELHELVETFDREFALLRAAARGLVPAIAARAGASRRRSRSPQPRRRGAKAGTPHARVR
jgi:diacylglycerol O-acyltransferase